MHAPREMHAEVVWWECLDQIDLWACLDQIDLSSTDEQFANL